MPGNSLLRNHQSKSHSLKDKIKDLAQNGREKAPLIESKSFLSKLNLFQDEKDEEWDNRLHMSTEGKQAQKVYYPKKNDID